MPEKRIGLVQQGLALPIIHSLFNSLHLREISHTVTKEIGLSFSVNRSLLLFLPANEKDNTTQTTRPPVEWSDQEIDSEFDPLSILVATKIQDYCHHTGHPLVVHDIAEHRLFNELQKEAQLLKIVSVLAMPIYVGEEPLATIILYQCDGVRQWLDDEVRLLEDLAYCIGLSLSHAIQYETLSQSESLYGRISKQTFSGIVSFDRKGRVRFSNVRFSDLSGLNISNISNETFESLVEVLVVSEDQSTVLKHYREALRSSTVSPSFEYRVRNAQSKKIRVVLGQFSPVYKQGGALDGFDHFCVDITAHHQAEERLRRSEARYRRLVEHSDAIIFHTNSEQAVTFISRRALDFFGMSPEDFIGGEAIYWFDLIHPDDRQRVRAVVREMQKSATSFDEEFRVMNRVTGRVRWLLTRLVPVRNTSGDIEGWDGFGIDITARREAQEALVIQNKKVKALYTVSAAIRGFLDPVNIANRGLQALCEATNADAGVCYFYSNSTPSKLSLISHHGLKEDFPQIASSSSLPNLANYVATQGQSIVVSDMRSDPRAGKVLAEEHGLRSGVLVPLSVENETVGALGLFSKQLASFDGGDVMLVSAAANQIGLAARQANLFSAYRRQTNNLSALYRMSHELSRNLSLDDMFLQAFTIIRDELGLKRLWLGLLNETGTRIIGQAAYGPGWKRKLVEINVEISGRDHPLARVVLSKKLIVIDNPSEVLREFGVRRIFSQLGIHAVALVPLVSSEQVLGVLAVQPGSDDPALDDEQMTLLSSLASEIATILLTKRFEERIQESEKMRTAGLLAAGVAHNFNNLLQAILGQASLLEMQGSSPEKALRASHLITEAASKGAELVKKLLGFAHLEEPAKERCDINDIIERNIEALKRSLGKQHVLEIKLAEQLPRAFVDPKQMMQILHAVVTNAKDAMEESGQVEIFTKGLIVDQDSPHYEVPYGKYILIGIRDNGSGMDEETKRRCFEPFFTTKNVDPSSGLGMSGSGLGLAAAYALARTNGGRLVVDSRVGHGSLFTVYIPVAEEMRKTWSWNEVKEEGEKSQVAISSTAPLSSNIESQPFPEGIKTSDDGGSGIKSLKRPFLDRHLRIVGEEEKIIVEKERRK